MACVENTAEHATRRNVFRNAHSSGVNGGCKRLVTEFRQRFGLRVLSSPASLLNEGVDANVCDQVQMVKQCFGFLIRKVRSLKDRSTRLGGDMACLRVRTY